MPHHPPLFAVLLEQIQSAPDRRITFAKFMDLALYHPTAGYYTRQDSFIGPQGDFVTSPHLGHDFGELLAVQVAEFWQRLDRPSPFTIVEMGAGQGLITGDLLHYLAQVYPDCFATVEYQIVEKSAAMRAAQQQRLANGAIASSGSPWTTYSTTPSLAVFCRTNWQMPCPCI
jgi:SAM-dependent MidA family methyltransferase